MNKHKRNLEELRRYLGRDTAGLKLLDAIARDLDEQRKRISILEKSAEHDLAFVESGRKKLAHGETRLLQLKGEKEREQSKRITAEHQVLRLSERIAELTKEDDGDLAEQEVDDVNVFSRRILSLFKEVRKIHKQAPRTDGCGRAINLDDLLVNYTGHEFMQIGKLVAFTALFMGNASVTTERLLKNAELTEDTMRKMTIWLSSWVGMTKLEKKLARLVRVTEICDRL